MAQSLAKIIVHLTFSTKNRVPLITPAIEPDLYAYMGGIMRDMKCPEFAVNGIDTHLHIGFLLARTVALSDAVMNVKRGSSLWIKTKGPEFAAFDWQDGYGAFSVGESGIPALRRYIANQKEHHRTISFQDELRALLRKYNIAYDERYLWD